MLFGLSLAMLLLGSESFPWLYMRQVFLVL